MPSSRVGIGEPSIKFALFDVVGTVDADDLVAHAGLVQRAGDHRMPNIPVVDMAPPLRGPSSNGMMPVGAHGTANLSVDESRKVTEFINRNEGEHAAFAIAKRRDMLTAVSAMYRAHPHAEEFYENGRRVRTLFSCAGFVYEAYKSAKIKLLDPASLPSVDLGTITHCYGRQFSLLQSHGVTRESIGLAGSGPWPVMLCGYLMHSLDRPADAIRGSNYIPDPSHIKFTRPAP